MAQSSLLGWTKTGKTCKTVATITDAKAEAKKRKRDEVLALIVEKSKRAPKNKDAACAPYVRHPGKERLLMTHEERLAHPFSKYRVFKEEYDPDPDKDDFWFCPLQYNYMTVPNQTPEIHFYGPAPDGTGVSACTDNFEPYFYASLPHIWYDLYAGGDKAKMEKLGLRWYLFMRQWTKERIMEDEKAYKKYSTHLRNGYAMLELSAEDVRKGIVLYDVKDMKGCTIDFSKDPNGVQETAPTIKIRVGAPVLVPFLKQYFWYPRGIDGSACGLCGSCAPVAGLIKSPYTDQLFRNVDEVNAILGAEFLEREQSTKWFNVLKHDSRCPAVFHGSCIVMWRRAQRLRGDVPDESKSKKYAERSMLFRCPCCQSRAHSVHAASFEAVPQKVSPFRGRGKFKGRDWKSPRLGKSGGNHGEHRPWYEQVGDDDHVDDYDYGMEEEEIGDPDMNEHSVTQTRRASKYQRYDDEFIDDEYDEMPGAIGSCARSQDAIARTSAPQFNEAVLASGKGLDDWKSRTAQQPIPGWFDEFAKKLLEDPGGNRNMRLPLPRANEIDERGRYLESVFTHTLEPPATMTIYEANVEFVVRCRLDEGSMPSQWVRIPKGKWSRRTDITKRRTTVAVEVVCRTYDMELLENLYPEPGNPIISKSSKGDYPGYAEEYKKARDLIDNKPPISALIYDVEMETFRGAFPTPASNRSLQTGFGVADTRRPVSEMKLVILTVGTLAELPQACNITKLKPDVYSYPNEKEYLKNKAIFEQVTQCHVHGHWNGNSWDDPYEIERARLLGMFELANFGSRSRTIDTTWTSGKVRTRAITKVTKPGVSTIDGVLYAQENYGQEKEHNLNRFSKKFLGANKLDIDYNKIAEMQRTPEGRANLAEYLMYDVILTARLILSAMDCISNILEESRLACTTIEDLIQKGAQHKSLCMDRALMTKRDMRMQVYRKADFKCVFPSNRPKTTDADLKGKGYGGAIVLNPVKGYYGMHVPVSDPKLNTLYIMTELMRRVNDLGKLIFPHNPSLISTLDFSALYPSLMLNHNLCYSTYIMPALARLHNCRLGNFKEQKGEEGWIRSDYAYDLVNHTITETENCRNPAFIHARHQFGVIPAVLEYVLSSRAKINAKKGELIVRKQLLQKSDEVVDSYGYTVEQYSKEIEALDIKQNKRKLVANSKYGILGLPEDKGQVPSTGSAATVTALGKHAIIYSYNLAETTISPTNGYECQLRVIYGDTDSIMFVLFGPLHLIRNPLYFAYISKLLGPKVSAFLGRRMKIVFEKIFMVALMVEMKFYATLMWMPDGVYKMDIKGLRTKRRDSDQCQVVAATSFQDNVILDYDPERTVDEVGDLLLKIQKYDVPIHHMSKNSSFSKNLFDPTIKRNAAVNVALNIYEETGRIIQPGTRFNWVTVEQRPSVFASKMGKAKVAKKTMRSVLLEDAIKKEMRYDREQALESVDSSIINMLMIVCSGHWNVSGEEATARIHDRWYNRPEFKKKTNKLYADSPMGKYMEIDHIAHCANCRKPLNLFKTNKERVRTRIPDQPKISMMRMNNKAGDSQTRVSGINLFVLMQRAPRVQRVDTEDGTQTRLSGPFLHHMLYRMLPKIDQDAAELREEDKQRLCEKCMQDESLAKATEQRFWTAQKAMVGSYDECRACPAAFMKLSNGVLTCSSQSCNNLANRYYVQKTLRERTRELKTAKRRPKIQAVYEV